MRASIFLLLTLFSLTAVSGCSWVGRTAGKAQAKIEESADDTKSGYKQGYQQEKAKSQPKPVTEDTAPEATKLSD